MFIKDDFDLKNIKMDNVLAINQKVNELQQQGIPCINASIGMLFDEHQHLANVPHIDELIKANLNESTKKYGSVTGGDTYQQVVSKWVLKDRINDFHIGNIATPGGTGAISLAIHNYVNKGQHVFIPSPHWVNYDKIIALSGGIIEEYPIDITKQCIDMDMLKKQIQSLVKKEGRIFFLLNDPGQNPTGYSLSCEEYLKLVSILQEVGKDVPTTLLVDYAYADYSSGNTNIFDYLPSDMSFLTLVAVSFSKTLSIYGLRLGSLLSLASHQVIIDEFNQASKIYARGTWSSVNSNLIAAVNELFTTEEYLKDVQSFLNQYKGILALRADALIKGLKEKGYSVYPYRSGFFVTIHSENSHAIIESLNNHNVFCLPMTNNDIRISVSCIFISDIEKILLLL